MHAHTSCTYAVPGVLMVTQVLTYECSLTLSKSMLSMLHVLKYSPEGLARGPPDPDVRHFDTCMHIMNE